MSQRKHKIIRIVLAGISSGAKSLVDIINKNNGM